MLKLFILSFCVAISTNGFHGETDDSYFRGVHKKAFGLYCNERQPDSAINDIWKNVGVFHCSTEKDPEKFCSCVSKSLTTTDQKVIEKKTAEIEEKLKKGIRKRLKEDEYLVQRAKLRHLNRLRNMAYSTPGSCLNEANISSHGSQTGKELLQEDYKYLGETGFDKSFIADNDFNKLLDMAEVAKYTVIAQELTFSVSRANAYFDTIRGISEKTIAHHLRDSVTHLYPSEAEDTELCGTDFKEVRNIDANIIEKFLALRTQEVNDESSDSSLLAEAVKDTFILECQKLGEDLLEDVDEDGNEIINTIREDKANAIFQSFANLPDDLRNSLNYERVEDIGKLSSSGDKREIDELEVKFFYDIAFCKLSNQLTATAKDVAQRVQGGGEDLVEMNTEMRDIETELQVLDKDVKRAQVEYNNLTSNITTNGGVVEVSDLSRMEYLQGIIVSGERKMEELSSRRATLIETMEQKVGSSEGVNAFRGSTEYIGTAAAGVVGGMMNVAQYEHMVLENKEQIVAAQADNIIVQSMSEKARDMVKTNLEEDVNEILELNTFIKNGDGVKVAESMFDDQSSLAHKYVTKEDQLIAKKNVQAMVEEIKENQNIPSAIDVPLSTKSEKIPLASRVKPNIIQTIPVKRERSSLESVVNRIDQGAKRQNTAKDLEIKNALERISQQENLSNELKEKTSQLKSKESGLNTQISALKTTLDRALETAEAESQDIKKLQSSLSKRIQQKKQQVANVRTVDTTKKVTRRPSRRASDRKRIQPQSVTAASNSSRAPIASSLPSNVGQPQLQEAPNLPPTKIAVDRIQADITAGTPVLTLKEFSQIADENLKISNSAGKVRDRVIIHTPQGEVLMQAVYENGKAVEYKVLEAVDEQDFAKELVREKVEILGLKEDIFKYDEFLKILNSSKK